MRKINELYIYKLNKCTFVMIVYICSLCAREIFKYINFTMQNALSEN